MIIDVTLDSARQGRFDRLSDQNTLVSSAAEPVEVSKTERSSAAEFLEASKTEYPSAAELVEASK